MKKTIIIVMISLMSILMSTVTAFASFTNAQPLLNYVTNPTGLTELQPGHIYALKINTTFSYSNSITLCTKIGGSMISYGVHAIYKDGQYYKNSYSTGDSVCINRINNGGGTYIQMPNNAIVYFTIPTYETTKAVSDLALLNGGVWDYALPSVVSSFSGSIQEVSAIGETLAEPTWPYNMRINLMKDRSIIPGLANPLELHVAVDLYKPDGTAPFSISDPCYAGGTFTLYSDSTYSTQWGSTLFGYQFQADVPGARLYDVSTGLTSWAPTAYCSSFPDYLWYKFLPKDPLMPPRYGKLNLTTMQAESDQLYVNPSSDSTIGNSSSNPDVTEGSTSNTEIPSNSATYNDPISLALKNAFLPTQATTDKITALNTSFQTHAPFSYVSSGFNALNSIVGGMNSSSPPGLTLPIMGQSKTIAFTSPWVANIRPVTTFLIWSSLIVFGFKQYRSITGGEGK